MNSRTHALVGAVILVFPGALGAQGTARTDVNRDLERLSRNEAIADLPVADSVAPGARSISAGSTVHGTVVARGPIDVLGRVEGSVVSLSGDVTVHRGGVVTGDALAVGGHVHADSGEVNGEMRSMAALPTALGAATIVVDTRSPVQRTADAAKVVGGGFGILLVIAIGVLLFAGPNLDQVVATIEGRFARAFWVGALGQIVALPALAILVIALALTILGVLLIPFAIVAYCIAVAGLVTLGFLAVARLVGGALYRSGDATVRMRALGALAIGLALFFALWMIAALITWAPLAATVVRAAALAATWAAVTLGLGATLLSRAGTHMRVAGAAAARPVELASWQTPTPVAGVVAARRPVAPAREAP